MSGSDISPWLESGHVFLVDHRRSDGVLCAPRQEAGEVGFVSIVKVHIGQLVKWYLPAPKGSSSC